MRRSTRGSPAAAAAAAPQRWAGCAAAWPRTPRNASPPGGDVRVAPARPRSACGSASASSASLSGVAGPGPQALGHDQQRAVVRAQLTDGRVDGGGGQPFLGRVHVYVSLPWSVPVRRTVPASAAYATENEPSEERRRLGTPRPRIESYQPEQWPTSSAFPVCHRRPAGGGRRLRSRLIATPGTPGRPRTLREATGVSGPPDPTSGLDQPVQEGRALRMARSTRSKR